MHGINSKNTIFVLFHSC